MQADSLTCWVIFCLLPGLDNCDITASHYGLLFRIWWDSWKVTYPWQSGHSLYFDHKDRFRHVLGVFAHVAPRLWVPVGVCRLELAACTRWPEQPQGAELAWSRATADGRLTARAYGRQTAGLLLQPSCPTLSRMPALTRVSSRNFSSLYALNLPGTYLPLALHSSALKVWQLNTLFSFKV